MVPKLACITNESNYILGCYRYIELTPVYEHLADKPEDYRWSSYHSNALGKPSKLLQPHAAYQKFGDNPVQRAATYHDLFRKPLDKNLAEEIRTATQGNYALGTPKFAAQVEKTLKIRATRGKAGRPQTNPVETYQ